MGVYFLLIRMPVYVVIMNLIISCQRKCCTLFNFECKKRVDNENDALKDGQSGLGETDVGVWSVELPSVEVLVREDSWQYVEDGTDHAEEKVHCLVDGVSGKESYTGTDNNHQESSVGSGDYDLVERTRFFKSIVMNAQNCNAKHQFCDFNDR